MNITTNISDHDVTYTTSNHDDVAILYLLAVVQCLILIGSLVGNVVVFVFFYKKKNLLTPSNRLICNLALANFAMAILVMPFVLVSFTADRWLFGEAWCQVVGVLTSVFLSACIFTLVLISIDRYCAVVTPLRYSSRVTRTKMHVALVFVWAFSLLISIPPLFGWSQFTYQRTKHTCTVDWKSLNNHEKIYSLILTLVCFLGPFILVLIMYVKIFCAAKANHQRARRRSSISQLDPQEQKNLNGTPQNNGKTTASRRPSLVSAASSIGQVFRLEEWKAAKTSLVIVFAFCICWIPYFVIIVLNSLLLNPDALPWWVESSSVVFVLLDCMLNPFVYVFRNKVMWDEICTICKPKPKVVLSNGSSVRSSMSTCEDKHAARYAQRSMSFPLTKDPRRDSNGLGFSQPVLLNGTIPEEPPQSAPLENKLGHLMMNRAAVGDKSKSVSFGGRDGDLDLSVETCVSTLPCDLAISDFEEA